MMLPAFEWLTLWGFLLGLAESFLYAAYAGLVFCPIYNFLHRRWGGAGTSKCLRRRCQHAPRAAATVIEAGTCQGL